MTQKSRGEPRSIITKAINLSLLVTMLTLLVTSVHDLADGLRFLPLTSTFTARQIHTVARHIWASADRAVHLGLHWTMIMGVVRGRLGITKENWLRAAALRLVAATLAAYGVHSWLKVDVGSKLFMQMSLLPWDFAASAPAFFVHHAAIVALGAVLAHYGERLIRQRRRRPAHPNDPGRRPACRKRPAQ